MPPDSVPSAERHSTPGSAAIRVTEGDRYLLHALAHNLAAGKLHAARQAAELVPVVAQVPHALALFEELVAAVRDGDETEADCLLDLLTAVAA